MAKKRKYQKRTKKAKYEKKTKKSEISSTGIILIAGLSTLIIGIVFAIIQFLGERYGFSPIINLGVLGWGESGDAIIVIVIIFLSSIFIGTILVLSIIRKKINKL